MQPTCRVVGWLGQANGSLADVAVLYRTHSIGRNVYQALKDKRIPCATSSADVFARPDVAPLLAALRVIANPVDDAAFRSVACGTRPPLENTLLDKIVFEAARVGTSLHAAAKSLHASSGLLAMDSGCSQGSLLAGGSSQPPAQQPGGASLITNERSTVHALLSKPFGDFRALLFDRLRRSWSQPLKGL